MGWVGLRRGAHAVQGLKQGKTKESGLASANIDSRGCVAWKTGEEVRWVWVRSEGALGRS